MNIIIAPDSFKGSLTALQAAHAIEQGIKRCMPRVQTIKIPIADGGEGTLESLISATGGKQVLTRVSGPLGEEIDAYYGVIADRQSPGQWIAVIEMAQASGITLIEREKLNPLIASTYGTGQLIQKALDDGHRRFILGLGGSATNDGGAGMLQALGLGLIDAFGQSVAKGGGALEQIERIDTTTWDPRIAESQFLIATDVQNPLVGPNGATRVFGPQKGATPQMIERLEQGMVHWADLIAQQTGVALHERAGAGAAGGICGAFLAFFPATMRRGIDVVLEAVGMDRYLSQADLVITGEGRIDEQTASGKTPMGVAQLAKKHQVPTIAFAGSVGKGIEQLHPHGIEAVYSIMNAPMTLDDAMIHASDLLSTTVEQVMRTIEVFYLKNK